jgi:AbrB family looped-hinge helix DNA binding protein
MNAITEIDKAGRVVIPKKLRDAMHLRAGDRLSIEFADDKLVIASESAGLRLHMDRGWLVLDGGAAMTEEESLRQISDARDARMNFLAGESGEP